MKQNSSEKKDPRGGYRPGAGRKRISDDQKSGRNVTYYLKKELIARIEKYAESRQITKSKAVEEFCLAALDKNK